MKEKDKTTKHHEHEKNVYILDAYDPDDKMASAQSYVTVTNDTSDES